MKFDHFSLTVSDLDTSAAFYGDILSLPEIENKTGKKYIRWFGLENGELHLIEGSTEQIHTIQNLHLALTTTGFEQVLASLDKQGIPHFNSAGEQDRITVRPDGIRQAYFRDPDGYWLEVNDAATQNR